MPTHQKGHPGDIQSLWIDAPTGSTWPDEVAPMLKALPHHTRSRHSGRRRPRHRPDGQCVVVNYVMYIYIYKVTPP